MGAFVPIMTVVAAAAQAKQQRDTAAYNAKVQENNAATARQEASAKEDALRRSARQQLGQGRAAVAQAGVGFGGSAKDVMEQSALNIERDALYIRYEGESVARGLLAQAKFSRYEGKASSTNTLLSGLAQAYGQYPGEEKTQNKDKSPIPEGG